AALDCACIERPHRVEDRMIVGVEDVLLEPGVTGDVDLRYTVGGNSFDVVARIEVVVLGRDVDVVDVEKNAAIGLLDYFIEELPFGHLRDMKLCVAGDIFDSDGDFEKILRLADLCGGDTRGLKGVRHGEKVV